MEVYMNMNFIITASIAIVILFFWGIRIVRPTHKGLIERLGKYNRFAQPGFHWVVPIIERLFMVNITEQMVNAESTGNNYQ